MELAFLTTALVCSLAANAYFWRWRKSLKSNPQYSLDARQILHDLTRGEALVRIARVDPEDVLLRSPKGRL